MKKPSKTNIQNTPIRPGWPEKIAPTHSDDEDWDYPPPIKEMISLLAKSAAIKYLDDLERRKRGEKSKRTKS